MLSGPVALQVFSIASFASTVSSVMMDSIWSTIVSLSVNEIDGSISVTLFLGEKTVVKYSPNNSDIACSSVTVALLSVSAKSACRFDLLTLAYWYSALGFSPIRADSDVSYCLRLDICYV